MTVKVTHPAGLTGSASGMNFENGTAEVDSVSNEARAVLAEHGFKFSDVKSEKSDEKKTSKAADKAEVKSEKSDEAPVSE